MEHVRLWSIQVVFDFGINIHRCAGVLLQFSWASNFLVPVTGD